MSKISETFTTGAVVPASGIYSVSHGAHRLFSEVALFKGEFFPKCERCSNVVTFELLSAFHGLDLMGTPIFRTVLKELSVVDEISEQGTAA